MRDGGCAARQASRPMASHNQFCSLREVGIASLVSETGARRRTWAIRSSPGELESAVVGRVSLPSSSGRGSRTPLGGARARGMRRWRRIVRTTLGSVIAAMTSVGPLRVGRVSQSIARRCVEGAGPRDKEFQTHWPDRALGSSLSSRMARPSENRNQSWDRHEPPCFLGCADWVVREPWR